MGEPERFDGVVTAALDIVALSGPGPVLAALTGAASRLTGLAAAATLAGGVPTSGAGPFRAAFDAGFAEGPGGECLRSGRPIRCDDLRREQPRWLSFVAKATAAGATGAWALPIRRDADHCGALLLLGHGIDGPGLAMVRVLAEAAAVAVLRTAELERVVEENRQLQAALQSRIVVEQAKGILAEYAGIGVDEAFVRLRSHARRQGHRLGDLAGGVARREIAPSAVLGGTPQGGTPTPPRP